jgi:hypothetical protein
VETPDMVAKESKAGSSNPDQRSSRKIKKTMHGKRCNSMPIDYYKRMCSKIPGVWDWVTPKITARRDRYNMQNERRIFYQEVHKKLKATQLKIKWNRALKKFVDNPNGVAAASGLKAKGGTPTYNKGFMRMGTKVNSGGPSPAIKIRKPPNSESKHPIDVKIREEQNFWKELEGQEEDAPYAHIEESLNQTNQMWFKFVDFMIKDYNFFAVRFHLSGSTIVLEYDFNLGRLDGVVSKLT